MDRISDDLVERLRANAKRLMLEVEYDNDESNGPGEVTFGRVFVSSAGAMVEAVDALAILQAELVTMQAENAALWAERGSARNNARSVRDMALPETTCAGCGQHKHTPLRRDEMGGYVCLSCVDRELSHRAAALATLHAENAALRAERDGARAEALQEAAAIGDEAANDPGEHPARGFMTAEERQHRATGRYIAARVRMLAATPPLADGEPK